MEHENDMEETLVVDVDEVEIESTTGSTDEALDDGGVEMVTCSVDTVLGGAHVEKEGKCKEDEDSGLKEEVAMLKENCRKQMNHIHMLETRLKQITKKTKLAEQETLIDKIQHSIEYFDHLTVKDSPPTLVGAIFTFIVPIVLIILGVSKWNEYNESTNLFTTTTYFTSASRKAFPTTLKCVARSLEVGSFQGGGSMSDILRQGSCNAHGKVCTTSNECCESGGWICKFGRCERGGFRVKASLYSACKFNTECQTNFCGKLRYYILHAY